MNLNLPNPLPCRVVTIHCRRTRLEVDNRRFIRTCQRPNQSEAANPKVLCRVLNRSSRSLGILSSQIFLPCCSAITVSVTHSYLLRGGWRLETVTFIHTGHLISSHHPTHISRKERTMLASKNVMRALDHCNLR